MSVMEVNHALNRAVTSSSESTNAPSYYAVDGDVNTFWQPLGSDRHEDGLVWMSVDLGDLFTFNQVVLKLASGFISGYTILHSSDSLAWETAFRVRMSKMIPFRYK
ncbi:discoidin domain-containing protein [Paenibacillus sp. TAF58]